MKYIVHKKFNQKGICGDVCFDVGTPCDLVGKMIFHEYKAICVATSENAHEYFTRDDDGQGLLRGRLTQKIQELLRTRDENYQDRWDKIWADDSLTKYKRIEHPDFWLWNHEFFNAPVEDLKYIANLIGIEENLNV